MHSHVVIHFRTGVFPQHSYNNSLSCVGTCDESQHVKNENRKTDGKEKRIQNKRRRKAEPNNKQVLIVYNFADDCRVHFVRVFVSQENVCT